MFPSPDSSAVVVPAPSLSAYAAAGPDTAAAVRNVHVTSSASTAPTVSFTPALPLTMRAE